jgi:Tol biopolymer transport system component
VEGRLRGPVWSPDGRYIAAHHEPGTDNGSKAIWVFPFSPDGPSVGEPTRIALPRESGHMISGWTPENRLAAFMESETHQAVYTVPASGGNAVQVTPEQAWIWYPRWSADGNRIYVRTVHDQVPHVRVQSVPAAGGELVDVPLHAERWLIPRVPGGGFNVSPDGDRLVVSAAQEPYDPREGLDIWTIPLNGGHPTRLTSDASFEGYPCWSPDGRTIAFTDVRATPGNEHSLAIYTVPAEGGEVREVASESDSVGWGAIAFSPDGERIAFFSNGAIKTVPSTGGQPPEVLVADVRSSSQSDLAWSPDGTKIAYSSAGKIWIASVHGGAPEELRTGLPEGTELGTFSWSPDGEKIAFVGSRGGQAEFWLISDFLPREH